MKAFSGMDVTEFGMMTTARQGNVNAVGTIDGTMDGLTDGVVGLKLGPTVGIEVGAEVGVSDRGSELHVGR